ncbi:MAG: hypothetical protein MK005_06590 [Alcanivorax sp.]|nr:hypothetical protein [Alcanivorax sp.]
MKYVDAFYIFLIASIFTSLLVKRLMAIKIFNSNVAAFSFSIAVGALWLSAVPVFSEGLMMNKDGKVVDPMIFPKMSLGLFVFGLWLAVIVERFHRKDKG